MRNDRKILAMIVAFVAIMPLAGNLIDDSDATGTAGNIIVDVDGFETTYTTMKATMAYANSVDLDKNVIIKCEAGKPIVFDGNHITIQRSVTIEGNDAYAVLNLTNTKGEVTFDIETYGDLLEDTKVVINSFHNATVWGQRDTSYGFTLEMNDCNSGDPTIVSGFRVYISGASGDNNITLNNCDFGPNSSSCTVYSNANGTIVINNCSFEDVDYPININSKSNNVAVNVSVTGSSFVDCGTTDASDSTYAAPIRVVSSGPEGSSNLTVDSCTFEYSAGKTPANGDVLVGDGRNGKISNPIAVEIKNTDAELQIQEPGYYLTDSKDESKVTAANVEKSQTLNAKGDSISIEEQVIPDEPDYDSGDDDYQTWYQQQLLAQQQAQQQADEQKKVTYVAIAAGAVAALMALMIVAIHSGKL